MYFINKLAILSAALALFATAQDALPEQQFADLGTCGEITDCRIGYRTMGTLNEARDNAVLVPAWYGGNTAQMGFFAAPNMLDPEQYFIILVDPLGNGVSTSPSNSPSQPLEAFPQLTIADMVESQYRLLTEHLGITHLRAITGFSMGGMQTFEWAARYPEFADHFIPMAGSPRLPAFDILRWETSNALRKWERECRCPEARAITAGFGVVSRPIGVANNTVAREDASSFLAASAATDTFDLGTSWNLERQGEAMINHDITLHFGGDMAEAAREIGRSVDMLVIVAREDRVVSPEPALDFARLAGAPTLISDAGCGHGDIGCAAELIGAGLSAFVSDED